MCAEHREQNSSFVLSNTGITSLGESGAGHLLVRPHFEPWHDKTNKMAVPPAKTQISLGIRPVWSEPSLCAQWVAKDPSFLHADSKDSDQTGQMPRLIWVSAGAHSFCWFCHVVAHFMVSSFTTLLLGAGGGILEPRHEKTCLQGFQPGKTRTCLHSYRDQLESWNFGFHKYRYYAIQVANNKGWSASLLFAYG